jgi:23S rRNA (adenine2503-C2)-methyltransferase
LIRALSILNAEWGLGIGSRRITISTSGLAPQIKQLADEPPQYRLAISLHGSTDEVRNRIMPINKRYPLEALTEACEYYTEKRGKMITLEYILIAGVNDAIDLTRSLAELAIRLRAKVNLIPYNTVEGLHWRRPSESQQDLFFQSLLDRGVTVTLRREKGHDIDAACGQLRLKAEKEKETSSVEV